MKPVCPKRVRELLEYDPVTGLLCWRASRGSAKKGAVAGYRNQSGYVYIQIDGKYTHLGYFNTREEAASVARAARIAEYGEYAEASPTPIINSMNKVRRRERMKLSDVENDVAHIKELAGDDESAHSAEDKLHVDVLRAIAEGTCDDPKACAGAALKTLDISFERWCA